MAAIKSDRLSTATPTVRRSARNIKREALHDEEEASPPSTPNKRIKTEPLTPSKISPRKTTTKPKDKTAALQSKKLSLYAFSQSPFPNFPHPTPQECALAHSILASLHGNRTRPSSVLAPTSSAGCGASPSVLDALVRTILSQNTSNANSTRAKLAMDKTYRGSDNWAAIVQGGRAKLQKTIQSGGLASVKSQVIMDILHRVHEQHGVYSLDHLFDEPDDAACMREMLSFKGIGPKTASCVLLFCLGRESFAVDTHVHRITGLLGWRPESASRDETHAHLDVRIPGQEKYPLHVLFIAHGRECEECKAGGKSVGKCELRKAFRKSNIKGEESVGDIKQEEIKQEENVVEMNGK